MRFAIVRYLSTCAKLNRPNQAALPSTYSTLAASCHYSDQVCYQKYVWVSNDYTTPRMRNPLSQLLPHTLHEISRGTGKRSAWNFRNGGPVWVSGFSLKLITSMPPVFAWLCHFMSPWFLLLFGCVKEKLPKKEVSYRTTPNGWLYNPMTPHMMWSQEECWPQVFQSWASDFSFLHYHNHDQCSGVPPNWATHILGIS